MKIIKEISFVPFIFLMVTWHSGLKGTILLLLWVSFGILEIIRMRLKQKEKQDRMKLEQGSFYMEQLLFSFRRHHKILAAWKDVSAIAPGKMGKVVREASHELESGFEDETEFLQVSHRIEKLYDSRLMRRIHEFLIHVEEQGGECETALGILLAQVRSNKQSRKLFTEKYQLMRSRLTLSVMLSCLIHILIVRMIPESNLLMETKPYQIGNGIAFFLYGVLYLLFYRVTICPVDGGYSEKKEQKMIRQAKCWYERMVFRRHGIGWHLAAVQMEKEVRLFFPDWLFDMLLRLQTENLQTALHHSLDSAPEILIRPLCRLIQMVEEDPVSMEPYHDFLKELDLPEIHSMMLQLYAVNTMGKDDIPNQICAMLEQQRQMQEQAERIRLEERLTGIGLLAAIPMMVSILLMLLNMGLGMLSFLQQVNKIPLL